MSLIRVAKVAGALALALWVPGTVHAAETASTPAEFLAPRPNNLPILPEKWIETRPLQFTIAFSLKSAPNSPAANAFLKTLRTTLKALPQKMEFKIYRQVTPNRFQYTLAMSFPNWAEYWAHEHDPEFLKYFRASWKPEVTEVEERITLLDEETR